MRTEGVEMGARGKQRRIKTSVVKWTNEKKLKPRNK
jgi:hypothetical protein